MSTPPKYPTFEFGDHKYVLRPSQLTVRQRLQIRDVTGMSVPKAMGLLSKDADVDVVAVLYYAAAIQGGDDPNWNTILDSVTADEPIRIGFTEDDDPET